MNQKSCVAQTLRSVVCVLTSDTQAVGRHCYACRKYRTGGSTGHLWPALLWTAFCARRTRGRSEHRFGTYLERGSSDWAMPGHKGLRAHSKTSRQYSRCPATLAGVPL